MYLKHILLLLLPLSTSFLLPPPPFHLPTHLRSEVPDLGVDDHCLNCEEKMENTITSLQTNLQSLRTGRASPSILDRVNVDYYGAPTPLNSLATVSVSSAQQLTISPFDKSTIADIERSIIDSDLGLTPSNSGDIIRLNIPPLTEERRKEMIKMCKSISEDAKVSLRNARRDAVDKCKKLEKAGKIGEDELKNGEIDIDELAKGFAKKIEEVQKNKEEELMKV